MDGYDLIGDIHGHAEPLRRLLEKLGYRERLGCYRHPHRRAIFLGDFIDRGPGQREVIEIVRRMTLEDRAWAVMGNHEFNALAFHEPDPAEPGAYLRPRSARNIGLHQAFLDEYQERPAALATVLEWFRRLPLWLDLGELRVVHAAWHRPSLRHLRRELPAAAPLPHPLLVAASRPDSPAHDALETVLKGVEIGLPGGISFHDKAGNPRHRARVKWWLDAREETWRSICFVPGRIADALPDTPLPTDLDTGYAASEAPVFIGHYWLAGTPAPLTANVACLDYSVALPSGKLVAYRWDGEPTLSAGKFVWVQRQG